MSLTPLSTSHVSWQRELMPPFGMGSLEFSYLLHPIRGQSVLVTMWPDKRLPHPTTGDCRRPLSRKATGIAKSGMGAIRRELQDRQFWSTKGATRLTIRIIDFGLGSDRTQGVGEVATNHDHLAVQVAVETADEPIKRYPVETDTPVVLEEKDTPGHRMDRLINSVAQLVVNLY